MVQSNVSVYGMILSYIITRWTMAERFMTYRSTGQA